MVEMGAEPGPSDNETDVTPGDDPTPQGNGGQNQVRLLSRIAISFNGLFRDAIYRLATRSKRDSEAVTHTMTPVLDAIAGEATRQACQMFRLAPDVNLGQEQIVRDYRKALEGRVSKWPAEREAIDLEGERDRAVRYITLNIFREAGSSLAQAA